MSVYALLLCAGDGTRMGASLNKTLLPLNGVPAAVRAARALNKACDGIVWVVRAGEEAVFHETILRFSAPAIAVVVGGRDRQESVERGLAALPEDCDIALVHDGARPFPTERLINEAIESARAFGSGVPAIPVKDTIKVADEEGRVISTPDRKALYAVQTPQVFRRDVLAKAHALARTRATDDAALVEAIGESVHLTRGDAKNLKLTGPEDIIMAEAYLGSGIRVGHGYDAHRLVEGRKLILCGVEIPFEKGLLGHSDADAALHALMDALLGALALGDIGKHFPDSDPAYRGISSLLLAEKVYELISERGFSVGNVDITIIAQRPKLAPFIPQMRANVARALHTDIENVSVKATTTEGMGFEGRAEGISAHAVALLQYTKEGS